MTSLKLNDPGLFVEANLVNGQWITAADGAQFAVTNPATGDIIGHVAEPFPRRSSRRHRYRV